MNREMTFERFRLVWRSCPLFYICICACVCVLTAGACHSEDGPGLEGKELRHTVIFYMAGENSLSEFVASDSAEVVNAAASLPADVRLVLFIDDTKSSRICVKTKDEEMTVVKTYENNVCSTDSASMLHVLRDIVLTYPAKSYGLVCWSHATGWLFTDSKSATSASAAPAVSADRRDVKRRSFGIDNGLRQPYNDNGKSLNIPTMAGLMAQLPHFEYVMFDACFMQCVEVAYELRNVCNWVISSPAEIPADGAPYESVLPLLCADPFQADAVVDAYHRYYDSGPGYLTYYGVELSAVATAGMEQLASATRQCVQHIWGGRKEAVTSGVQYYTTYSRYPSFFDMESLFHKNLPEADYERWCEALAVAVPYVRLSDRWTTAYIWANNHTYPLFDREHCTALSIYAPTEANEEGWNADYRRLQWYHAAGLDQTGW